jgi:hypothetical protein
MPRFATVNRIEISPHRPGRAFLAVQRYRIDDWNPYIFRTNDYGQNWDLLTDGSNGIPANHWVRVVREDDVQPGLLYAGTEFGAFVSFDDGVRWQALQMNLPATPVTDMKVHQSDLVLSTQGRSFWVLDDLTPLRELAADLAEGDSAEGDEPPVALFTPRDVARGRASPPMSEEDLTLPDPLPQGALLSYAVTREVEGLELVVLDSRERTVASWQQGVGPRGLATDPGFHRLAWALRYQENGGIKAPPGNYRVRLSWEGGSKERSFDVLPNPSDPDITQADYEEQFRFTWEVQVTSQAIRESLSSLRDARDQAEAIVMRATQAQRDLGRLSELLESLKANFAPIEAELTSTDDPTIPTGESRPIGGGLARDYGTLFNFLNSGGGYGAGGAEGRPTAGAIQRKRDLDQIWGALQRRLQSTLDTEVAAFNAEVTKLGLEGIVLREGGY